MFASTFRKIALSAAIIAIAPGMAGTAFAKTQTASFDVSMKIVADCTISATGIDFGQTQGVLTSAVGGSSAITVACTNTTPYSVGLNAGTGTGSSGTDRFLSGSGTNAGTVRFNLYKAPGASPWGNTQGSNTLDGTGTGTAQSLTVYGEIPAQATPSPDNYKSTITATVYF